MDGKAVQAANDNGKPLHRLMRESEANQRQCGMGLEDRTANTVMRLATNVRLSSLAKTSIDGTADSASMRRLVQNTRYGPATAHSNTSRFELLAVSRLSDQCYQL